MDTKSSERTFVYGLRYIKLTNAILEFMIILSIKLFSIITITSIIIICNKCIIKIFYFQFSLLPMKSGDFISENDEFIYSLFRIKEHCIIGIQHSKDE